MKLLLIIRVVILLICSGIVSHATFHATTMTNGYDALGRKVWGGDQESRLTQYQYDRLGRLVTVTNALGDFTGYGYDQLGNMLRMTNALQNAVTQFEYDKAGRRIQRILPWGQTERTGQPSHAGCQRKRFGAWAASRLRTLLKSKQSSPTSN